MANNKKVRAHATAQWAAEERATAVAGQREAFRLVKRGIIAIALGHPEHVNTLGRTSLPPAGLFDVIGTGFVLVAIRQPGFVDPVDGLFTMRLLTRYILDSTEFLPPDVEMLNIGDLTVDPETQFVRPVVLSSEEPEEGDRIAVCGYPHGLRLHSNATMNASFSSGIVSAVLPGPEAQGIHRTKFQLDAMILGGTSGGPAFDPETGAVLGMVTQNYSQQELIPGGAGERRIQIPLGFNWALHVHAIRSAYEMVRKRRDGRADA